jgi:2-phospho-L-lactate/phosphoenolpyruvate guanylyltransferase
MNLHILVPCKPLADGKSRLSAFLGAAARREICGRFLENTLHVALSLVPTSQCHVVTSDAAAISLVGTSGAAIIGDPGLGLNVALSTARDQIRDKARDNLAILILPIDLPHADKKVLSAFIRCEGNVVIAADRRHLGTNALLIREHAVSRFEFRFGPASFPRHQQIATAAGFTLVVHEDPRLAFDVDNSADYREWRRGAF